MFYFKALPVLQYAALAQQNYLAALFKSPADNGPFLERLHNQRLLTMSSTLL
jgi:hypothetical protein